jgi:hypothetical protein
MLYDEAQVIAKGPVVSVSPPVLLGASVVALGTFNRLQAPEVAALKTGLMLPMVAGPTPTSPPAEMLTIVGLRPSTPAHVPLEPAAPPFVAIDDRQQVVALVRLQGHLAGSDLIVGGTKISPGAALSAPIDLAAPPAAGGKDAPAAGVVTARSVTFTVQRVYAENPTFVTARLRIIARPEVVAIAQRELAGARPDPFTSVFPQLLSAKVTAELEGETKLDRREGRIAIVDATVRVPVVAAADGWLYDGKPLRPGVEFIIDTPRWQMGGAVLSLESGGGRVEP